MSLASIPKGILTIIQEIYCRFLWKGSKEGHTFAWARWDLISLPKKWGGQGLKDIPCFSRDLAAKMGWHILTNGNLWTKVISNKYIIPLRPIDQIINPTSNRVCISLVWCAIINSIDYIRKGLAWRVGSSNRIRIRKDPWSSCGNTHSLSLGLILFLGQAGISTLDNIIDLENTTIFSQSWKLASDLNIPMKWFQEWSSYIGGLTESHVRICDRDDELIWIFSQHGRYTPKDGYFFIYADHKPINLAWWWRALWKLKFPPKEKLFMWHILSNKAPTCENLQKRGMHVPSWCAL